MLRDTSQIPAPSKEIKTQVLIVGGGIAGLSAKRWLRKNSKLDVLLIEMAEDVGGNSAYGENNVSAYPWGAHYLPIPSLHNIELIDFLHEHNIIIGFDTKGLPIYNEYYLCHDPEERLNINGHWQEGIIPQLGVPDEDKKQIKRFLTEMDVYRSALGSDGKDAFAIPLDNSTCDEKYRALDSTSFKQYLTENGYTSTYLLWYLEYCCKDDYGCNIAGTSAWAGIHYFAGRKGKAANADPSAILSWPEGNGFLVKQFKKEDNAGIMSSHLVYKLEKDEKQVTAYVYDAAKKESITIVAEKIIMATPQYVNKKILADVAPDRSVDTFDYAPWIIANITINGMPAQRGLALCWDNVVYDAASVGYVNANHQNITTNSKKVLTFYLPYTSDTPKTERNKLYAASYEQLQDKILEELNYAHPGIRQYIEHMDIRMWGHGMIAPVPGLIWGTQRHLAKNNIDNKIFFAHSDLSGISIFEEAFYQGIKAANEIMGT